MYDELNLTEISYLLNYSSVAHLSNQFKKVTGLSPSHFKLLKDKKRIPLEEIGNTPTVRTDLNVINQEDGNKKNSGISILQESDGSQS